MEDHLSSLKATNYTNHLETPQDSLVTPSGTLGTLFIRGGSPAPIDDSTNGNLVQQLTIFLRMLYPFFAVLTNS
ncbi:hypothetical protein KIN20_018110 [Parelaphostrongylus tenuis]|uniref:Uncharacterized protein n=1 Tax=Parelaphostrongylus tenuis TaxID=148309 RepID=A0AAD5QRW5_PARTN|nr:hypothetical protein KIN20_018110 [Parelaphostrongylus tenuis]